VDLIALCTKQLDQNTHQLPLTFRVEVLVGQRKKIVIDECGNKYTFVENECRTEN